MQYRRELLHRAFTCLTLAVFLTTMLLTPAISGAQTPPPTPNGALTVPITGAHAQGPTSNALSNFTGSFTIQQFMAQDGKLFAVGTVVGHTATGQDIVAHGVQAEVTDIRSIGPLPTASLNNAAGVQAVQAACPILHLVLGPINLNLLGLVVTTNQIVVDIVAQPGPGNLLGNLLCQVASLLNSGGTLSTLLNQLVGLLNQILAQLGAVA